MEPKTNNESQKLRVCLASSAGGHTTQLLKIAGCWKDYNTFFVTTTDVVQEELKRFGRVYVVGECNRQHPVRLLRVLVRCIRVALLERPDVVISTGAAAGCIMCVLAKMLGAKIVWIDSITNVTDMSLSGRIVRPMANLLLVQWPELAKRYKGAEYAGALI